MSETTEELHTAVQTATTALAELSTLAGTLSNHATEFAEEADGHGWHGVATRMQDIVESLDEASSKIDTGQQACDKASEELGLINDKIPAEEVETHLTTSTAKLDEAVTALDSALEKSEAAQEAANEIGQQGMMEATTDFHNELVDLHRQITKHQETSETERAAAEVYVKRQLGK